MDCNINIAPENIEIENIKQNPEDIKNKEDEIKNLEIKLNLEKKPIKYSGLSNQGIKLYLLILIIKSIKIH